MSGGDDARGRRSVGIRLVVAACTALLAALIVAAVDHTSSDSAAVAATRSCGSVLRPGVGWSDCVDTRRQAEVAVVLLGLLTMLLSAAALRVLRVRDIDPDAPPPHRIRRAVGAVGACCLVASVGLALAPMRAGPVDCGGLHIPSPSLPQNEFGNIDPGCIDRYQGRSTLVVIVAALGLALVVGSCLRSTQRSPRPTRLTAWVALIMVALGATLSSVVVVIDRFEFYSGAG